MRSTRASRKNRRSGAEGDSPRTRVCTSLSAATCGELAAKASLAISRGSDLVEFRLDFLRGRQAHRVKAELGQFAEHAIFTLRRNDEGGGFVGTESERLQLMKECADVGPAFFDVELQTLDANPELRKTGLGGRTIVSWHGRSRTPPAKKLLSLAAAAAAYGGDPEDSPTRAECCGQLGDPFAI